MITLKMISEKFNAWRRYRDAVRELSQFSDHELCATPVPAESTGKATAVSMRHGRSTPRLLPRRARRCKPSSPMADPSVMA
jgi:hypothetical protein